MPTLLTTDELERLRTYDTPTVANAIETFDIRPRTAGFMTPAIRSIFPDVGFPDLGVMVGYAVTARARSSVPTDAVYSRHGWWDALEAAPRPRIAVIQDVDDPPVGAFWGEVQSNIHRALGCEGAVTNGGVRDLREAHALGFHYYAGSVMVSHAYVNLLDHGEPVEIGGLTIHPGDLIHADRHGVHVVPLEIARDIPAACETLAAKERRIIELCQSPAFALEELKRVQP
ncbi:MAG: RraA family protein [Candidatus Velthaea sp.]